jgi:hypothetical protein
MLQERLEKLMFIVYYQLSLDDVPPHDQMPFDRKFTKKMATGLQRLIKVRMRCACA